MATSTQERPYLRLHREPDPLASYLRPLERDYKHTAELISAGFSVGSGVIVDACHPQRSEDLRCSALEHGIELVLDPRSIDLSTDGGIRRAGVAELPWSCGEVDRPDLFGPDRIDRYADGLAEAALERGVSAVLEEGRLGPSGLGEDRYRLDMWRATISAQVERDLASPPTMSPALEAASYRGMDATGSS